MRPNGLVLNPVSTERVSDVIAERLSAAIRDGTLQPGDQLPTEAELARDFHVGRTSVREGLQKLRAHGLIETRKGLGAFVTASDPLTEYARWAANDPASIEELTEARVALETLAAALAAVRATDEEIARIERLSEEHAAAQDTATLVASDHAFHCAIMAAAGNRFVSGAYDALELTDFRAKTLALPWAGARSAQSHATIARAIGARDAVAARQAMADHLYALYAEIREGEPLLPREALG